LKIIIKIKLKKKSNLIVKIKMNKIITLNNRIYENT